MKHAYDRELSSVIESIVKSLEILYTQTPDEEFLPRQQRLFRYIISGYRRVNREEFMQTLQKSRSEIIQEEGLTLAEQFEEFGRQQGLEKGLEKGREQGIEHTASRKEFKPHNAQL